MIKKEVEGRVQESSSLSKVITTKTVISCSQCPLEEGKKKSA